MISENTQCGSPAVVEKSPEVGEAVEINVGRVGGTIVHAEAVIYGGGKCSGVSRGLHVDFGITDNHGFARRGVEFTEYGVRAEWVGLFPFKTVSAVDGAKIFREAEGFEDAPADAHRLVRENGHREFSELLEGFGDAWIGASGVHFVVFVIAEKKFQRVLAFFFRRDIAERASDKLRGAVADVPGNGVLVKLFAAHLKTHGVDGMDQVALGIDERAVEIKNQHAHRRKIGSSHEPNIVIPPGFPAGHEIRRQSLQKFNLQASPKFT
jgi:hypothetical protein